MAGMLILAFVVAIMLFCLFIAVGFLVVVAVYAIKGVEGERQTKQEPTKSGGYTMVYKEGRVKKTQWLPGNTEQEALSEALKLKVRYDQIVSLTKN